MTIPFHMLSTSEQIALIDQQRNSVTDEQVDKFLEDWGTISKKFMGMYRVVSIYDPITFSVLGKDQIEVIYDDILINKASASEIEQLKYDIRSGYVSIGLCTLWRSYHSSSIVKVIHSAKGKFTSIDLENSLLIPKA